MSYVLTLSQPVTVPSTFLSCVTLTLCPCMCMRMCVHVCMCTGTHHCTHGEGDLWESIFYTMWVEGIWTQVRLGSKRLYSLSHLMFFLTITVWESCGQGGYELFLFSSPLMLNMIGLRLYILGIHSMAVLLCPSLSTISGVLWQVLLNVIPQNGSVCWISSSLIKYWSAKRWCHA